jgi:hypothetical protein
LNGSVSEAVVVAAHLYYLLVYFKVYLLNVLQAMNIVSIVNLNCKLDLQNIALSARNAEYNPKVYDWA